MTAIRFIHHSFLKYLSFQYNFILYLALIVSLILPHNASAKQNYICSANLATGFSFSKSAQNWVSSQFLTSNKYTIVKSTGDFPYIVNRLPKELFTVCTNDIDENDYLNCGGYNLSFRININTMKYVLFYVGSYIDSDSENADTPLIEIGICDEF